MEEYRPSLRLCDVERPAQGSCGFHLSRTQWDPYPWVSGVDPGSAAEVAGLRPGDCVLEVNGEDVLGQRIGVVAARVRARVDRVSLLLWNAGSDPHAATSLSAGSPTPLSLQRLSSCLQAVLQLLECPVCLETVPPPAYQCCNGHLLCAGCRSRAERCPVCRVALGPRGRCLLADQLHAQLSITFSRPPEHAEPRCAERAPLPPPLVQLKSRLLLQPKASSEENVCEQQEVRDDSPLRARSLSTGQIPSSPAPSEKNDALFHCPYGAACDRLLPGAHLLPHLQEAHDGPLVRYFQRSAAPLRMRLPEPGAESVSVTTADGSTFFVQVAETAGNLRLVWLWLLGDPAAAEQHRLRLTLPQGEARVGPVFPLTASWADVVSSSRCLAIEDRRYPQSSPGIQLEILSAEVLKSG